MAIDTVVFRTTDQRVLDEITTYEKEHKAWRRRLKKLVKELDPTDERQPIVSSGGFSSTETFVGLSLVSADYRSNPVNPGPPAGWRVDKKRGVLLPHKSKPEGKAIAKKIDGCQPPKHIRQRLLGMPHGHMNGLSWCRPGLEIRENETAVYVLWSAPAPPKIDRDIWEQVALSKYYALVEREDAAKAGAAK